MAKINPIEVQKALKGVNYPAKKEDIVRNAKEQGADDEIVRALENISADEFESPTDINEAIGKQS
jgi:hypothetical protein